MSEEELSLVLEACAKYPPGESENSSVNGSTGTGGLEETYESRSQDNTLKSASQIRQEQSENMLQESTSRFKHRVSQIRQEWSENKLQKSTSTLKQSTSQIRQEQSDSKLEKSTSAFKQKSKISRMGLEEREDVNMWKAIKLLFEKPEIRVKIKEELKSQISPAASSFIDYFKSLQDFAFEHLTTSARLQEAREQELRKKWHQNEKLKEEIEQLKTKLEEGRSYLDMRLKAKTILIFFSRAKMERMNRKCRDDIKRRIYESERSQITYWKESEIKQQAMNHEIGDLESKMAALMKTDLKDEKDLRGKKLKAEMQLVSWLNKYDLDIGEKQAEYDEIMTGFDEEKKQMEELQEQFEIQNEQYIPLMQEKEDEERAIFEHKMYIFLCNRAARRIQRYWRAYRARKLARRKARRQKKAAGAGGKKGKKVKKGKKK